jgi:hypothetical protein
MKQETITRIKLTASNGKVLTNGTEYGREIFLAETESADNWHEITEKEYAEIQAAIEAEHAASEEVTEE